MDEKKALKSLKKGSQQALVWFIENYSAYVGAIITRILQGHMSQEDMEEVASDVFLALWNQAGEIRTENVKAYLGRVARNKALNKFREAGLTLPLEEDRILVAEGTPEDKYLKKEAEQIVNLEVKRMKEPEREILLRYYYYFQTVADIAREMDMNPATVKTKLRRARQQLKQVLTEKLR